MHDVTINEYQGLEEDFYDAQTRSLNPLRAWFHTKRFELVRGLVETYYKRGDIIVDLACGNCNWNKNNLPVIGVDVSEKMLQYAYAQKRINKILIEECENVSLKGNSVTIIVLTEALEHMNNPEKVLQEINRILKKDGLLICTVPYDTNISLWKPLFKVQCFIQGYIFGKEYYKKEGGHVNHFSPKSLQMLLEKNKLRPIQMFDNKRFTIFTVAKKEKV